MFMIICGKEYFGIIPYYIGASMGRLFDMFSSYDDKKAELEMQPATAGNPAFGMSNAMMQEQMRASQNQQGPSPENNSQETERDAGKAKEVIAEYDVASTNVVPTEVQEFMKTNLYKAMVRLVDVEKWDPEYAASWLGQAVVETGNETLKNLDVVEKGSGAGRGMFQYTADRRKPYDRARQQAIANKKDPNDINWQIDYALQKDNAYVDMDALRNGLTDPNQNYKFNPNWGTATGKTPSRRNYGNKFSDSNQLMSAYKDNKIGGYTRALTGEFTRPGIHHMDRREKAAKDIYRLYKQVIASQKTTKV